MKKLYIYLFIAISFTLFYFLWLLFSPVRITTIGAVIFSIIAPSAALVLQIYTFRKSFGLFRKFIALFIIGTGFYLLAEVIWSLQILLFLHTLPFPGLSDLFYILSILMFIVGFFYIASTRNERFHFINFLLDITIIYFTVTSIFFLQFLIPLFIANGISTNEALISALYPALDILLLIVMIICFIYKKEFFTKSTKVLFILAAATLIVGDTVFKIIYYQSLFSINSFIEPVWTLI